MSGAGAGRTTGPPAGLIAAFPATLARYRVVAVVRHGDPEVASGIARGCIAGGLGLIEITTTVPDAFALVADLVADAPDGVVVGAGTVLDADQVAGAVAAGARFLVSPVTDPDVLAAAAAAGVPFVPGAATPTEVGLAARLGAPVVKVFPAGDLGLSFLRAVVSVMPRVPLLPSGGIGVADVPAWLAAGAVAVAIGGELNAAHARGGVDAVTALAASAVAAARHHSTTPTRTHDPMRTHDSPRTLS